MATHTGAAPSRGRRFVSQLRRLYAVPTAAFGTTVFVLFLALALLGPWIAPYGANQQDYQGARMAPSSLHWFGTDHLGRDVFSRVLLGAGEILWLSGGGTLLAVLCGTAIGLLSGYLGGWLDELIMRLFDSLLALPALLLALLMLGILGASAWSVLIVMVVVYTPIVARVVRSVVLSVKTRGFVEAARLQGESLGWILFREILPSVLPTLAVETAVRFSYGIFLVASLGFLGVGVQPPSPNWGLMVKEARQTISQTPWALYYPAGAISILVIGVNLMADGLKRIFQTRHD
ncbi:MAG: ABC transporter permease [Anaerolineales bacterium]|nr:MAG: ABC transporter permease [Anaerolineales bacterium]